jgi:hypothetical protein
MAKRLVLSVESVDLYVIKTAPPKLAITAHGYVSTSGWRDSTLEIVDPATELSPDGVLDLNFMAEPPGGISLQVLTPVTASFVWEQDADKVVAVRVVARTNEKTQLVTRPVFTTFALGEETPVFPTPRHVTTFIFGEESPSTPWPRLEQVPTGFAGEHWPPTDPRIDDPANPQLSGIGGEGDPGPGRSPFGQW